MEFVPDLRLPEPQRGVVNPKFKFTYSHGMKKISFKFIPSTNFTLQQVEWIRQSCEQFLAEAKAQGYVVSTEVNDG